MLKRGLFSALAILVGIEATRMFRWANLVVDGPRRNLAAATIGLLVVIGFLDYASGDEISFSVVYVLPIAIAAWQAGLVFASAVSILSVTIWMIGDIANGYSVSSWLIPVWNCVIRLVFYYVVIHLLLHVRSLTLSLEERVQERTAELRTEMAARQSLEIEMLEVSERERRRLSADLHDGVCQHLTGTALVVQALREKLAKRELPEAFDAAQAVDLIEEGIALSRNLAKGLQPVDLHAGGLMQALQEFAASTNDIFKVSCRFECESPIIVSNATIADHLYHIAREATGNAVKHGRASSIVISLDASEEGTTMTVQDDGVGIAVPVPRNGGMGLRNMFQRAQMIRAKLDIRPGAQIGTVITCYLPANLA